MSDDTVRVAVRIRPLVPTENEKGCQKCIGVVPGEQQIQIRNTDKAFTFNHVFGPEDEHEKFYETAIRGMVDKIFKGYNVTILAYGQTGSGKTHTMGTNYTADQAMGVIPRTVYDIFNIMQSMSDHTFKVTVSFMELYQEQVYDLLSNKNRNERIVDIREETKSIKIVGLTEKEVTNAKDTLQCLSQGSLERVTGATAMNAQSSRSHAIFTILIQKINNNDPNAATTAKFHLVDLAGSERSKKTQATGERFKEGVNINKGLLALGNVISQLGEGRSISHVSYRDSKLTRLLQDSLGGNSMTLMIACVSPADYNLDETLSTLRYADRVRKIKNKPIINQDPKAAEINRLNNLVQELRMAAMGQGSSLSCPPEHTELQEKNRILQMKLRELTDQLNANLIEIVNMHERAELAEQARENIQSTMEKILEELKDFLNKFDETSTERALLEPIYKKVLDLQNDQKKTAEEMIQHELTSASLAANKSLSDEGATHVSIDDDTAQVSVDELGSDFDEKNAEHTLRQTQRNHEIKNINRCLALREELIAKLVKEASPMSDQSKELQDMENEIKTLHTEKEELMRALQNHQTNNASAKLAQTRRKKVQELEKKIAELSRKCTEQMRVIKGKEKSDQQIKNLTIEISSLKQTRVKLIREMRKDGERFAQWKRANERELGRLKDQDRKRQNAMIKLQTQHDKQQNVYKRKMEEASAINKRLKEALELQHKAQLRREKHSNGKESGIQNWVRQELAVLVSTVDAECSLEKLMQDRAQLTKELERLKTVASADSETQIAELTEYLELRNAQIADLQQKIIESDQENRANIRCNFIQSMGDAKIALKVLFETTAADRKKTDELMEKYDACLMENRKYQLREKNNSPSLAKKLKAVEEELQAYKEKYDKSVEQEDTVIKAERKKATIPPRVRHSSDTTHDDSYHVMTDDSIIEDDVDKDPDWMKTPLYTRIRKIMVTTKGNDRQSRLPSKRTSDGEIKCACKGACSSRMCTCRKNNAICGNCSCNAELCKNRDKENATRTLFNDETITPEFDYIEEPKKRPRLKS